MADSKRKGPQDKSPQDKSGGRSGRGVLRRRGRHQGSEAAKSKQEPDNRSEADNRKISPLHESTTQASEEVRQLLEAAGHASEMIREAAQTEAGSGEERVEGDEPAALISQINSEVRTVLEAADEAAEKIREEAHADARRLIDENRRRAESVTGEHIKRVTEMTEQVLSQLAGVEDQVEALRKAFDQSIERLGGDLRVEGSDVWSTRQNGAEEEDDEEGDLRSRLGRRARPRAAEPEGISEGARLLALQQLMAGVDAEVIANRLTKEFGVKDPTPIMEWIGAQAPPARRTKKK